MKIEDVKLTKKERIKRFILDHPDEVFTRKELSERLGFVIRTYYLEQEEIESFNLSKGVKAYGCKEAIERLEERFKG